ncbi:MAG: sodium:solute symporter family protein [Myxococcota bacterium]
MSIQLWTGLIVGFTFILYIVIAIASRAGSTKEFYVAGGGVPPVANGMATAADWMSAASFISMAGLISFLGYDGSVYLMGWTGGYVLLALLLAPYLRKFGKFTVPDFVGDRYYSSTARVVAVVCAIFVSFTYVAGQMRGVGLVFARFLEVDINMGIVIGMGLVFLYATLGGMKGITYTQVAQYCILIFAFMVPAIFISLLLTGNVVPQIGFGSQLAGEVGSELAGGQAVSLLDKLNGLHQELGFAPYTSGKKSMIDVLFITAALMVGTAGLPHVIVRFYTVPKVRDARVSAGWALVFIAILYTTAPAVAAFARTNLIGAVSNAAYQEGDAPGGKVIPEWFKTWEDSGLIAWVDKNKDGIIQYTGDGPAFAGKPKFYDDGRRGDRQERLIENRPTEANNELYIDRDIMVLANPEIAQLPNWVIALVAAGGLAAALSTAAGLLLVVSTSIAHDLLKRVFMPDISESGELLAARGAAAAAVVVAGLLGIANPGFVAQVVAFAFGLAASSFFPIIIMGIFTKRMNREGAITGMLVGISFTAIYIVYFKFLGGSKENWLFGISPEGIGTLGMILNFVVATVVSSFTPPPPDDVQDLVESIRIPKGAKAASEAH